MGQKSQFTNKTRPRECAPEAEPQNSQSKEPRDGQAAALARMPSLRPPPSDPQARGWDVPGPRERGSRQLRDLWVFARCSVPGRGAFAKPDLLGAHSSLPKREGMEGCEAHAVMAGRSVRNRSRTEGSQTRGR